MAQEKVATTVPLRWDEVYFTNCPMVSANNVDQELGWCREEFKKLGVEYAYFRSRSENNWYPHYVHNLDNLIRFGGLYPPIHVNADIRRTASQVKHAPSGEVAKKAAEMGDEGIVRLGKIRTGIGLSLLRIIHQFGFGNAFHGYG